MELKTQINVDYILKELVSTDQSLIERLRDLGIYEGITFKIVNIISFDSVYVLQLNDSLVALNTVEMSCLRI